MFNHVSVHEAGLCFLTNTISTYPSGKREGAEITRWELPKVSRLTDVNN
jgi:hypothetical protein